MSRHQPSQAIWTWLRSACACAACTAFAVAAEAGRGCEAGGSKQVLQPVYSYSYRHSLIFLHGFSRILHRLRIDSIDRGDSIACCSIYIIRQPHRTPRFNTCLRIYRASPTARGQGRGTSWGVKLGEPQTNIFSQENRPPCNSDPSVLEPGIIGTGHSGHLEDFSFNLTVNSTVQHPVSLFFCFRKHKMVNAPGFGGVPPPVESFF